MSDPSPETTSVSNKRLGRWRIGTLTILQIVLFGVILIAANYLSSQYYKRQDLSRSGDYSLSTTTTRFLKSQPMQGRKDPVQMILAVRVSSMFYDRIRALAEEYARQSGGKIQLKIIDPVRNLDEAQKIAATYGVYDPNNNQLARKDLIILDARTKEQIDAALTEKTPSSNNVRIIPVDALTIWGIENNGPRRPEAFQGEDFMTAGLRASIEGEPRKAYYLADKSRIDAEGESSPWKTLVRTMAFQNVILEPMTLSDKTDIPADAAAVVLVAPKYDFTPEEIQMLERYWNRPKSAIMVLLRPDETPPRLRTFLRANGLTPRRDRVITTRRNQIDTTVRAAFTAGVPFLQDLTGQATIFEGATSSLDVKENSDETLATRQIHPIPLIQIDPAFWGETKFGQGKEAFDEREDNGGPRKIQKPYDLYLAAGVIRGAESNDRFASESSRMMVMTNTDFLNHDQLQESNLDFLAASTNWLIGREELAGLGPRSLGIYKLPLLDAEVSFINRINLFFIPAFVLLIAGFVWSSRRA